METGFGGKSGVPTTVTPWRDRIPPASVEAASQVIPPRRNLLQPWSIYGEILVLKGLENAKCEFGLGQNVREMFGWGGGGEDPLAPAYEGKSGISRLLVHDST